MLAMLAFLKRFEKMKHENKTIKETYKALQKIDLNACLGDLNAIITRIYLVSVILKTCFSKAYIRM